MAEICLESKTKKTDFGIDVDCLSRNKSYNKKFFIKHSSIKKFGLDNLSFELC